MKPRHIPVRTCTGCRTEHPKREMTRVVRTPAGEVVIDPTGKQSGRGAYVCPNGACWDLALRGSLAHVLKTEIKSSDREELLRHARALATEVEMASPLAT